MIYNEKYNLYIKEECKKYEKYLIMLLTTVILTGCSNNRKVEINDLQQFSSNNKIYTIKKGEELSLNAWNELEIYYSGKNKINKKKSPVIYKGVTLGTDYKDVIEKKIKNEKIDKLVCLGDLYYAGPSYDNKYKINSKKVF